VIKKYVRHLKAISTGVKNIFSNRLTAPYPDARQQVNERYRGMIRLNIEKCISCKQCGRVCPSGAIKMREVGEKKYPGVDYARCIFCGFCVEICTRSALEHTGLNDVAYLLLDDHWIPPEELEKGGTDPYQMQTEPVAVHLDAKKGLAYGRVTKQKRAKESAGGDDEGPAVPPGGEGSEAKEASEA
jgi:NADH-quinone oxidoreductase subunit I